MSDWMCLPGSTLGILGSGQLGRMLCLEARRMGYRTVVWSGGGGDEPTQGVADVLISDLFDSAEGLARFLEEVDVATVEFENVPPQTLAAVADGVPLFPEPRAISVARDRSLEKSFFVEYGIPCGRFVIVEDEDTLAAALLEFGESVLKTTEWGYDGKGQVKCSGGEQAGLVWDEIGRERAILEEWVDFDCEISVMAVRGANGEVVTYDAAENEHRNHVLDVSIVPARVGQEVARRAGEIACQIVEALDYRGILGVEFFVRSDGELLVNEVAPRPHNSGHHTMDACETSQFEQQLRAVCGLELGGTGLLSPVVMLNLLGDLWESGELEGSLAKDEKVIWHLYGKSQRTGLRKCGHANFLGEGALERVRDFKKRLLGIC
ncbi:MAG: 5-(carboxyamino)imidazole ribonucleotide synthase [Verrucomicrobiota bacterium]